MFMAAHLRVILDTNVLIDGARDEFSAGFRIINWTLTGELRAVVSRHIIREARVILRKEVKDEKYKQLIEDYFSRAEELLQTPRLKVVKEDRQDNKFIEAAAAGDVDYLITSDYHLLDLGQYQKTAIIKPEEFANSYERVKAEMGMK